ncbi:C2H2-type zinc finger protein [Endozoicomonas sp.]|uniref:C2H2-type zinc finger protein n=1 Tax=Endozoicomonas sp. TaxID=1892382 RepID=UPI003AF94193
MFKSNTSTGSTKLDLYVLDPERCRATSKNSQSLLLNNGRSVEINDPFPSGLLSSTFPQQNSDLIDAIFFSSDCVFDNVKVETNDLRSVKWNQLYSSKPISSTSDSFALSQSSDRPFRCDFDGCEKAFKKRSGLKTHLFIHKPISKYRCSYPECSEKSYFRDKHQLDRHTRSRHTKEKPYECELCHKSFTRLDHVKKHMQTKAHQS